MKLRELMNRVLRATGQTQIPCETSLIEEDNHLLILEFLNQFKEEIEANNFRSMKQSWTTVVPSGLSVAPVGSPDGSVSNKARILRVHDARFGRLIPLAYDITEPTQPMRLYEMDIALLYDQVIMAGGTTAPPSAFALDTSSASGLFLRINTNSDRDRTFKTTLVVPQGYLDVEDLDTEITIPTGALLIGTVWAVLQERGEELGQSSLWTEERYRIALDNEVSIDMDAQGEPELVPV